MSGIWVVGFVLTWATIIVLTVVVAGILRYLAIFQDQLRASAPPVSRLESGEKFPEFIIPRLDAGTLSTREIAERGKPFILLFATAACPSCTTVVLQAIDILERLDASKREEFNLAIIFLEKDTDNIMKQYPMLQEGRVVAAYDSEGVTTNLLGLRSVPVGIHFDRKGAVVAQSLNPHANWLYKSIGLEPSKDPKVAGDGAPLILPEISL